MEGCENFDDDENFNFDDYIITKKDINNFFNGGFFEQSLECSYVKKFV